MVHQDELTWCIQINKEDPRRIPVKEHKQEHER